MVQFTFSHLVDMNLHCFLNPLPSSLPFRFTWSSKQHPINVHLLRHTTHFARPASHPITCLGIQHILQGKNLIWFIWWSQKIACQVALYAKLGVNNHFILVPKDKSYKHLHLAYPSLNACSSRPDILATAKVIVSIVSYTNTMKLFNLPGRVPSASNLISGADKSLPPDILMASEYYAENTLYCYCIAWTL